ncbi:hypothetical protein ANANG_G00165620 [Anguilla anguilla]|uniref:Ig-like domain-containing protein n=1 Tax=Anguilla anguilla TaxID=7936 RepID=A0A9D3M922_ANGAN|nr:hypothetical protein ANANG_G00165620 [Anguilla anguilla]
MASDGSVTAIGLLLFTAFTQGFSVFLSGHFGMLDRSYSINATAVGQWVNLPCLQEKEHNLTILQIEWKKMEGRGGSEDRHLQPRSDRRFFWTNVSVSVEMSGKALKGSVLELSEKQSLLLGADGKFRLQNVTKDDAGTYLCQPRWASPGPHDDAANATVQLHVSSGQALRGRRPHGSLPGRRALSSWPHTCSWSSVFLAQ